MTKGVPLARDNRLAHATSEAKKVLKHTKSWYITKEHLKKWLRITYALSSNTVRDYIETVELRLLNDVETKSMMDRSVKQQLDSSIPQTVRMPQSNFVQASELDESTIGKV